MINWNKFDLGKFVHTFTAIFNFGFQIQIDYDRV